ncbi:DUF5597 domain-containing protein [Prolixibacter denitrificans]|nr:DUF5597 domain-containing protein [Prolixibacter denitrificans]PSK80442.1 beta-galactosidase GanA [Prolixibacter denitrificans]
MRLHEATLLFTLFVLSLNLSAQPGYFPHLQKNGKVTQLMVDGRPYQMLAGELGNSSSSDSVYLTAIWPKLKAMHLNTVLVPVYWELVEPEEGQFNFQLIDQMIRQSRENKIKLVLLWFGSWKNSMSCYAPAWVKEDFKRFPRIKDKKGRSAEILSPFYNENLEADREAYVQLLKHIARRDKSHQVIMVQVENEIGMLPGARDYSDAANQKFNEDVPRKLIDYLVSHRNELQPHLLNLWSSQGFKTKGNWDQVFGKGLATDEVFIAWYLASYANHIAAAGQKVLPVPLYVNCALNRPGLNPGQYPSGGPLPHLIDVWKAAAPDLNLLSPDIYHGDFREWSRKYDLTNNPLFIPEIRRGAENGTQALYVLGKHHALGFSPFSIESTDNPEDYSLTQSYQLISQVQNMLDKHPQTGVWFDYSHQRDTLHFGNYKIIASHDFTLGWSPDSKLDDWPASGGIIIQTTDNEFWVIGTGLVLTFFNAENPVMNVGLLAVDEAEKKGDNWHFRRLNGDQTHQGRHVRIPSGQWMIQRVSLYDYP